MKKIKDDEILNEMKNEWAQKRIKEILSDERFLFENAPLALTQLSLEVELHIIQKVLEIKLTDIKKLRKNEKDIIIPINNI